MIFQKNVDFSIEAWWCLPQMGIFSNFRAAHCAKPWADYFSFFQRVSNKSKVNEKM